MRYGIFSDIHSNLEAFETVLEFYDRAGIKDYIFCGDIVGYGPNPNECVTRVFGLKNMIIVAGNHDRAAAKLKDISWFNPAAKEAILWTSDQLTQINIQTLSAIGDSYKSEKFMTVHGSPSNPIDEYLLSTDKMKANVPLITQPVCFVGHSHVPFHYSYDSKLPYDNDDLMTLIGSTMIVLDPDKKNIVNVGSVGQPRDGDPRACTAVFNTDSFEVSFFRFEYDIKTVQKKMIDYNLPQILIDRLSQGK